MLKKQTAVEWLIEQISSSKYFYKLMEEIQSKSTIAEPNGILHKAKAMEKEQIIDAFVECWKENMPEGYECKQSAEYYYNETFGSVV
jgi:HEPN domain-containing protein